MHTPEHLQWDPKFLVGVSAIDDQHRALFALVNLLYQSLKQGPKEDIADLLAELQSKAAEHFATEEDLMTRSAYPGSPGHRAVHDRLRQQLRQLMLKVAKDRALSDGDVLPFLRDWMAHHISEEDKRLGSHLQAYKKSSLALEPESAALIDLPAF
jgi:hemerythrin